MLTNMVKHVYHSLRCILLPKKIIYEKQKMIQAEDLSELWDYTVKQATTRDY